MRTLLSGRFTLWLCHQFIHKECSNQVPDSVTEKEKYGPFCYDGSFNFRNLHGKVRVNGECGFVRRESITNSVAPEPEGSSPHSQQPANGPYPDPSESTPHPLNQSPEGLFWSHLHLGLWSGLFPSGFPTKNPIQASPLPCACHMPRPSHSPWFHLSNNIWWKEKVYRII
jgi:hypothetical protein